MATGDPIPHPEHTITDMRIQLGLLDSTSRNHEKLIDKLTEGIGKIEEVNYSLLKMLTLHDHKHEIHEESDKEIEHDLERIEVELDTLQKELHSRITTSTRETQNKIDEMKGDMNSRLDILRAEVMAALRPPAHEEPKVIAKTVQELERWKWMLMGAFVFILWLADKWEFIAKLFGHNH
jgi:DNA anti-recombination protein RmuC